VSDAPDPLNVVAVKTPDTLRPVAIPISCKLAKFEVPVVLIPAMLPPPPPSPTP